MKHVIRWIWACRGDTAVIATSEAGVMATPAGPFKHIIKRVSPIFIFRLIKTAAVVLRSSPPTLSYTQISFFHPQTSSWSLWTATQHAWSLQYSVHCYPILSFETLILFYSILPKMANHCIHNAENYEERQLCWRLLERRLYFCPYSWRMSHSTVGRCRGSFFQKWNVFGDLCSFPVSFQSSITLGHMNHSVPACLCHRTMSPYLNPFFI